MQSIGMTIDFNPQKPTLSVDGHWNLIFSHGPDANYLVNGKAIELLVDHIKYLEVLIANCPGNKND
jgi:hypothetical protein